MENRKYKWEYQATKEKQDAYEDLIKNYQIPDPQEFILLSQQEQENMVKILLKKLGKLIFFLFFIIIKKE